MTGMENVLAAHVETYTSHMAGRSYVGCSCGWDSEAFPNAYVQHVAEALTAAGFGNQHDAWERCVTHVLRSCTYITSTTEEWRHARLISDLNEVKDANPYPSPKVSET